MANRILRGSEVDARTGLCKSTRYELEARGEFPKRRRISARASGYLEHEIDEWIASRPRADESPAA